MNKKISLTLLQTTSYDTTEIIKRCAKIPFTHIMKQTSARTSKILSVHGSSS